MNPRAGRSRLGSPAVMAASGLIAFLALAVVRSEPADPESRLSGPYRLADLIEFRTVSALALRQEVATLRAEVDGQRQGSATRTGPALTQQSELDDNARMAGLVAMGGPGLRVTLNDSSEDVPPAGGSVNDLVVHSQDVQAVVNALWRSGAEAVSINGQRLVGTSAVLCVGNTLLLNGTVHSPPYVASAIGASRDLFEADRLVRRLKARASDFGLSFSVERELSLELPPYRGSTKLTFAQPAGPAAPS